MKLYVGNLEYGINDDSLATLFAEFGEVKSSRVIIDRETGRSKGFGFVEMASEEEGVTAISQLNGADVNGRNIKVNEAHEKQPNNRGGGGGGYNNRW